MKYINHSLILLLSPLCSFLLHSLPIQRSSNTHRSPQHTDPVLTNWYQSSVQSSVSSSVQIRHPPQQLRSDPPSAAAAPFRSAVRRSSSVQIRRPPQQLRSDLFFPAANLLFSAADLFFPAADLLFSAADLFFPAADLFFSAADLFFPAADLFLPATDSFSPRLRCSGHRPIRLDLQKFTPI